jgi:hypothetical protein
VNPRGERAFFLSTYKHSVTTSGHQPGLRSAAYGDFIFSAERERPDQWTAQDLWYYYQEKSQEAIAKSDRCRKLTSRLRELRAAVRFTEVCNKALEWFDSDLIRLDVPQSVKDQIADLEARYYQELEVEQKRQEKLRLDRQKQDAAQFQHWLFGAKVNVPSSYSDKIYLRLNPEDPNQVQTSRGVLFPSKYCGRLYTIFKSCMETGEMYKPGSQFMIGPYPLDEITSEYIKAGCHKILADEIERFAEVLGLN